MSCYEIYRPAEWKGFFFVFFGNALRGLAKNYENNFGGNDESHRPMSNRATIHTKQTTICTPPPHCPWMESPRRFN